MKFQYIDKVTVTRGFYKFGRLLVTDQYLFGLVYYCSRAKEQTPFSDVSVAGLYFFWQLRAGW